MQINTDFWGAPSTWYTATGGEATAEIKGINWNSSTLQNYWSGGYYAPGDNKYKWSEPPRPDVTPTAWGIGKDSSLSNPNYMFIGYVNPTNTTPWVNENVTPYVRESRLNKKTLDFCPQRLNYGITDAHGWKNRVYPSANAISNTNCQCGGMLSFKYNNIVVYPLLKIAKRVEHSNSYRFGLQDYAQLVTIDEFFTGGTTRFPNPAKNEYPLILAVLIGSWYIGTQPVYNNGQYISGERQSWINNAFSMRFNEPCKGKEYYKSVTFKYNNVTQSKSPVLEDDFYTLYPFVMWNSNISGYYHNRIGHLYINLKPYTEADTEDKAWTLPDLGDYPLLMQNGKYTVEAIQEFDGTNYYNNAIVVAIWDTSQITTTKDDILKDVAYLGFWFSEDLTTARRALTGTGCVDDKMHIPVFDSKGVTTGEWLSGTDAAGAPNAQWGDPFEDSPYVPKGNDDDEDFGDLVNASRFGRFPTYLKIWLTDVTEFNEFVSAVNDLYITDPDGVQQWQIDFKGVNPSDYIVAAYVAPFEIPKTSTTFPIQLGVVTFDSSIVPSGIMAYKYAYLDTDSDGNIAGSYDCGNVQIPAYYGDFRDYAPYTSIELYIPMCGTVNLDPEYFVGHSVNVQYFYDVYTMSLSAGIYRDGITLYKVVNGVAGSEIPLTSLRMGDYQNTVHNIEQALKRNEISTAFGALTLGASAAGAVATGGASLLTAAGALTGSKGIIQGLDERQDLYYDLNHKQPSISQTNAAESQNAFCVGGVYPHIFIKRAKMSQDYDDTTYSHTVGNACLIQSKIKDMSGLIKCSNVDLSGIPATAEELNAIQTALQNGVYV